MHKVHVKFGNYTKPSLVNYLRTFATDNDLLHLNIIVNHLSIRMANSTFLMTQEAAKSTLFSFLVIRNVIVQMLTSVVLAKRADEIERAALRKNFNL